MELLYSQPAVIGLAVVGALLSTSSSFLQLRGYVSQNPARVLNYAGYGLMAVSMLLFVLAGLIG